MTPVTKSELSTLIQKRIKVSGKVSIEAIVMAFFNTLKTTYCKRLLAHRLLLLVISNRGLAIL